MVARADGNGREGSLLHEAAFGRGLLGLAAVSTTITMTVYEPPSGLDKTTHLLSLSGVFFAEAVGGHTHAAGRRKLVNACVVAPVVVAAGLTVASLLLQLARVSGITPPAVMAVGVCVGVTPVA